MRKNKIRISALVLVSFFAFISLYASSSGGFYKIKLNSSTSRIWIEGDSTMHAYKSTSSVTDMSTRALFKVKPDDSLLAVITEKKYAPFMRDLILNLIVKLNVKNFHSSTPGFDSKFYEAIKADNYPDIVFKPTKYTIEKDSSSSNTFLIKSEGTVRIAEKEKNITVITAARIQDDVVTLYGQKDLLMTDFGLTPPELLFVKAYDKVTVKWNLSLNLIPES
ncbi:MAG TPA: YceI family protein [Spirochaetota bacterium]|nr:YceI family protein [Spirochaetota bacterium]HPS87433.1 YceI family protein [Spirochaetota bacterium]